MTPTRAALVKYRVVTDASNSSGASRLSTDDLLKTTDHNKLLEFGLAIAREWNFPHESEDASAYVQGPLR